MRRRRSCPHSAHQRRRRSGALRGGDFWGRVGVPGAHKQRRWLVLGVRLVAAWTSAGWWLESRIGTGDCLEEKGRRA